jgi:hypothetical protein
MEIGDMKMQTPKANAVKNDKNFFIKTPLL